GASAATSPASAVTGTPPISTFAISSSSQSSSLFSSTSGSSARSSPIAGTPASSARSISVCADSTEKSRSVTTSCSAGSGRIASAVTSIFDVTWYDPAATGGGGGGGGAGGFLPGASSPTSTSSPGSEPWVGNTQPASSEQANKSFMTERPRARVGPVGSTTRS